MAMVIDFDNPKTFPEELGNWDICFENMIRSKMKEEHATETGRMMLLLNDMHIRELPIVTDFLNAHMDCEVAVCHCSRILDIGLIKKEGLIIDGGQGSVADSRIRKLLSSIGVDKEMEEAIMVNVYAYWDRDKGSRTECVHFQVNRDYINRDCAASSYALNLGGEVLRRAISRCSENLYEQEPYKRLWIWGTPCIVKFKCKLGDVHETYRASLLEEIVKYNIVTKIYNCEYKFEFPGMISGRVRPENIIAIEEIKGFVEMQEEYEPPGFYDELKYKAK